jgi:two-component system sensor histidine kinase QseC
MKKSHSLQRKLLALVLGTLVCAWLLTTLLTWLDVRHELDELLDAHLAQSAAMLVMQQDEEHEESPEGVDAPSLHRYAPKVAFQVFHHGELRLHSANAPHTPMVAVFKPGFSTVEINNKKGDKSNWRVFATQGREEGVKIFVGESVSSRSDILWAVLRSILLPVGGTLPLLALAIWWVIHRSIQPIRQLGTELTQRKPDALEPLPLEGIPSEINPMVQSLNALLLRIAHLIETERRFTADASHELRTPIAAIRTQVQVAMGATHITERQHALAQVLEGCDRAAHLMDQLLTLSRLEASGELSTAVVDWSQLAQEVAAGLAPKAIAKNQTLELEAEQPCPVRGTAVLLGVLIRNLLDNAIRYSPPSAEIRVRVVCSGNRVALEVEDSGAGLSDADLARLGERFFRVLGNAESGSGLGWSIVQRIARIHQMEVQVQRSQKLGGLWVRVEGGDN